MWHCVVECLLHAYRISSTSTAPAFALTSGTTGTSKAKLKLVSENVWQRVVNALHLTFTFISVCSYLHDGSRVNSSGPVFVERAAEKRADTFEVGRSRHPSLLSVLNTVVGEPRAASKYAAVVLNLLVYFSSENWKYAVRMDADATHASPEARLLAAFRESYSNLESRVQLTLRESRGDSVVMERLGDELDQYLHAVQMVSFASVSLPLLPPDHPLLIHLLCIPRTRRFLTTPNVSQWRRTSSSCKASFVRPTGIPSTPRTTAGQSSSKGFAPGVEAAQGSSSSPTSSALLMATVAPPPWPVSLAAPEQSSAKPF